MKDIIPEYNHYIEVKTKYQRHELPDEAVVDSVCVLCQEIKEFLHILYAGTDMVKERKEIINILVELYTQFVK